jgi:hypothetical protein
MLVKAADEIADRRSAFGIRHRADHAGRLVVRDVTQAS